VASIRQAWDAALQGRSLEQAAAVHTELRQAIETYSNV
jgi:ribulose 1,5-bisphosphate carboxylase large subunit-like protein